MKKISFAATLVLCSTVSAASEVGTPPLMRLTHDAPVYPAMARRHGIQGLVLLEVSVNRNGNVTEVKVLDSPSPLLSDSAVKAVMEWKFQPMLDLQEGSLTKTRIPLRFEVQGLGSTKP